MKTLRTTLHLGVLLLLAGSLAAQREAQTLPPGLPPLGPLHSVVSPKIQKFQLANGMQIWLVHRPLLPKVTFTLLLRGGDSQDPSALPGLAQLMAQVASKGTTTRSSREIADAAELAGGSLTTSSDVDSVRLEIDSLSDYAPAVLALLGDISQHATFPEEERVSAKASQKNQLLVRETQPHFLAERALFETFYPGQSYRIFSPSLATLQNATDDDLKTLYRRIFRPDQALLIAVGQFDPLLMLAQIRKNFAGWKSSGPPAPLAMESQPRPDHAVYIVDRPRSVQTTMLISAPAPTLHDPDEPLLQLANTIYGSGFGSRLMKNIREDKGYSYHPGSAIETFRWGAIVQTHEDVRNAVTGASLQQTFLELNRMAADPPSEQELLNGKRQLLGSVAIALHSRVQFIAMLGSFWLQEEPADFLDVQMATVQKATIADVQRISAKYLAADRMTVIAVGEKLVIQDQLKPLGMKIKDAPNP
jgi:predicted Zn-dependent peptidase